MLKLKKSLENFHQISWILDNCLEKKQWNFENRTEKMRKSLTKCGWIFECWAGQKSVNLVDLVKSFQTIAIQTSIAEPRTGLSKFAKN